MAVYSLHVADIDTGAVANTFAGLLGLKFANTAGHRGRLRSIIVGGGGGAPQDLQISLRIRRTDNTGDGTSTAVNVNTIGSRDAGQIASNVAAIGETYTVEPTTYETETLGLGAMNTRGGLAKDWAPHEAPCWGENQTLVLEGAPGEASAARLEVFLEWEEY